MSMNPFKITLRRSSEENIPLNPPLNRVSYEKYINEVNDALQSVIMAGKLKRMQFMSINNRALFNRGKVQRSEWTNKKHLPSAQTFFPDVKNINLDTRSLKQKTMKTKRNKTEPKNITLSSKKDQQEIIDSLIEQQMKKIKLQKVFKSGRSQQEIVKEACRAIQQKLIQNQQKNISKKQIMPAISNSLTKHSHYRYVLARKDHRSSVTQSMYSQQLSQVQRKNNAILKQFEQNRKYFLHKIKRFNKKK